MGLPKSKLNTIGNFENCLFDLSFGSEESCAKVKSEVMFAQMSHQMSWWHKIALKNWSRDVGAKIIGRRKVAQKLVAL